MNIGLPLGSVSGIIGIDVDGEAALDRLKMLSAGDVPDTWTFFTPGGGKRYLYQLPKDAVAKKYIETLGEDHSELALLGDGQQTVLPPSIHPNGKQYYWFKGKHPKDLPIAPAPQWMLDLMTDKKRDIPPRYFLKADDPAKTFPSEIVFKRLQERCSLFQDALAEQTETGLSEDSWFLWISTLTAAGHAKAAEDFSMLSTKHDRRSGKRLKELKKKAITGLPMTRCLTFGCNEEQIKICFHQINRNEKDVITNSPGSIILNMTEVLPPSNLAYKPYLKALENAINYTIDEHGNLCAFDKKGNPYPIANFVARPVLEVVRDDGLMEDRTFRIEGVLHGGKFLHPVDVSAADFVGMTWPIKKWGIQVSIAAGFGTKDKVRDAIQNAAVDVPEHRIFTHLGWRHHSNRWVYLHSNGSIGSENVEVQIDQQLSRYCLPKDVPDAIVAVKASISILKLAPMQITIPLLALVYLSPLVESFKQAGLEPNFVVWLHGRTGTRKTSLAMLLLSHFGTFAGKNPPASFKDTANALEMRAFATKDTLLVIDDFHPATNTNEGKNMAQTAQRILRMYGDRIGRGRLKATIEFQRQYPPRGMALVTGEDLPIGQSSVARFLGIELQPDHIDLELLTYLQTNSYLLAEAMAGYIQWLLPKMDQLPDQLNPTFRKYREQMQQDGAHGRLSEAAAWLFLAFDMMLDYATQSTALKAERADKLRNKSLKVLTNLVRQQNSLIIQEKPEEIFVKALQELMNSGKVAVTPIGTDAMIPEICQMGDPIGWADNDYYYLLPEITYNAVSRFLQARGEIIPVKERTLWKHLDEAQLLLTQVEDGETRRLVKKTIPCEGGSKKADKRLRLLHIKRAVFDMICEK